jgi:hypothetical protein
VKALAGDHDEGGTAATGAGTTEMARVSSESISGRFWARVWDLDCVLELRLDEAGRLRGSFDADGEPLEVAGGSPGPDGAVRGVIRAHDLEEPFATFCARPDADGLLLEVDLTDEAGLEGTERVAFARLD